VTTTTSVVAETAASPTRHRSGAGHKAALVLAAVLGVVGLIFWLYAASIHANQGDSDGASVVLEGQAIIHGHLLLHGWALSLDSFWTVDALVYAVLVAIAGLRPGLLYAGPALIATAVIIVGILMARENRRGAAAIAGGFAVVALLAFPTHSMASFFLRGPLHVTTALWALIAFWAIRRGRFGLGWAIAVLMLVMGVLGDLQMVAYGVAPLAAAGLVAMLRQRAWRGGIAQLSAAVAGGALGEIGQKVAKALGGFTIGAANPIASVHQMPENAKHVVTFGLDLIGARTVRLVPGGNPLLGTGGPPPWLQDAHILAAAVMLAAFLAALVSLLGGVITGGQRAAAGVVFAADPDAERWRLNDMLLIATFAPPVAYVVLALTNDPEYTRYLTAAVIFASILTGRIVAQYWHKLSATWLARTVAAVAVAATMCFAAATGYTLDQPDPGQPAAQLVAWLGTHHLDEGVGDYWSASISTVESRGQVTIRPVVSGTKGTLRRYLKESDESWYAGQRFQFFVYNTVLPWGYDNTISATKTWGPPEHTYAVGTFRVLVWPKPLILKPNPPATS
jgi:hypothetical protein